MSLSKLELAKAKLALHAGFFISLTSKLDFVPKPGLGTCGTDGRHVFYDPDWLDSLTLPQVIGVILHEVGHNMLAHPARFGDRNKPVANIAMDIVLNELLLKYFEETKSTLNAELPPGGIFGPAFKEYEGWNWERVYNDIMQKVQQGQGDDGERKKGKGKGKGNGLPKQFDNVEPGVNEDGSAQTPQQAEALAQEWTMAAQQAATMAKQRGMMPGMFAELVADMAHPKVDWRSQVRDFFTKIAKDEQSWRRFNRRFQHAGMYLPGFYSERLGLIRFYIDVSGSMGSEEFKLGLGALNDIFDELKPDEIQVVQCDTRIVSDQIYTPNDLPIVCMDFKGRGGTILTPMFEHNMQQDNEPELVVCLTDGFHEEIDPKYTPRCPMLWLVTTESTQAAEASFGKIVRVEV